MRNKRKVISGVYCYRFKKGTKLYIGSSIDLNNRKDGHNSHLRRGEHISKSFQKDYNKYGKEELEYTVLEYIDNNKYLTKEISKKEFQKQIFEREQMYLDKYYAQECLKNKSDRRFYKLLYNKNLLANGGYIDKNFAPKEVHKYTLDGYYIESFSSIQFAAQVHKVDRAGISNVCRGKSATAAEFRWSWIKQNKIEVKPLFNSRKEIFQYDLDKNFIKKFNSRNEAVRLSGIHINKSKSAKSSGGYYWLYEGEDFPKYEYTSLNKEQIIEIKQEAMLIKNKVLEYGDIRKFTKKFSEKFNLPEQVIHTIFVGKTFKNIT